jgi:ATP-dependent RNA helicase RhlB
MKFTDINLHEDLLKGIEKAGYVECTPVQEKVLETALAGRDLYVQSQTGTGKTAAFLVAIIQEMLVRPGLEGKKALIMAPTRELAVQIEAEAETLLSGTNLVCASFYGGVGYAGQTSVLKKGVDILVGTPGRVIDLCDSRQMDLSQVAFLVIDEADRMFDMGFYPDLRTLIKKLPKTGARQTMLFSATLNTYVKNLAWEYTTDPEEITIESENVTVDEIDQYLYHVSSSDKMRLLLGLLEREKPASVLVFCNTKKSCEIVAKRLRLNGRENEFIIGDLPQSKRLQVLDAFKSGALTTLIATDVAARGIDVDDLSMVVNYDLPNETENYVHRIGRTARAGKSGKAITFCSEQDVYNLIPIERFIGMSIPSSMADEELFAEDKSANVYIKLDNYDDHDDYRDRDDRRSRSAHRDRDDRRPRSSRDSRPTRDNRFNRDNKPRPEGTEKPGRPGGGTEKPDWSGGGTKRPGRPGDFDQSVLGLSLDERMKLYKEKYGAGQTGGQRQSGQRRRGKPGGSPKGQGQGQRNAGTYQQGSGKSQKPGRQRREEDRRQGKKPPREQAPRQRKPAEQQTTRQTPPKKPGILQKLASIFKR